MRAPSWLRDLPTPVRLTLEAEPVDEWVPVPNPFDIALPIDREALATGAVRDALAALSRASLRRVLLLDHPDGAVLVGRSLDLTVEAASAHARLCDELTVIRLYRESSYGTRRTYLRSHGSPLREAQEVSA